jgi:hypothetical protein
VVNANSAKGKLAEIANICDYTTPDIIVMSENQYTLLNSYRRTTWLFERIVLGTEEVF